MSDLNMFDYLSGIENDFLEGNIPSDYTNNRVSKIADFVFYETSTIENAEFDNVEYVGNSAFINCSNLVNISLPKCKEIGNEAFSGCTSLANFDFLNTCEVLGYQSSGYTGYESYKAIFDGCSNFMSELSLPNLKTINAYAFYSMSGIEKIDLPNCEYIGKGAFSGCDNISYINLPNCECLGSTVFGYASLSQVTYMNLQNVKRIESPLSSVLLLPSESFIFNSDVEYIGNMVFYGASYVQQKSSVTYSKLSYIDDFNSNLFDNCEAVNLPECLHIGSELFYNHSGLKNVSLPKCKELGNYVFRNCSGLTSIKLPECSTIGKGCFSYCTSLSSVSAPKCASIDDGAFYFCSNLETIELPSCSNLAPYIMWGQYASGIFRGCSKLKNVSLPVCKTIGSRVFEDCIALSYIELPVCETITSGAFAYCSNLEVIKFGSTAVTFWSTSYTFTGCSKIREVHFSNLTNVPHVTSSSIFPTNNLEHIYVPSSMVSKFLSSTYWAYYSSYISGIY